MKGFDKKLIKEIYENIDIPLTVLGGYGSFKDIKNLVKEFKIIGIGELEAFLYLKVNIKQSK